MRNPVWVEDELILALALYLGERRVLEETDSRVIELSQLLSGLPVHGGAVVTRTPDAVVLRLANFRAFDPLTPSRGMTNGGRRAEAVWNRFANSPEELIEVARAIRAAAADGASHPSLLGDEAPVEGRLITERHRRRERDPNLRARKLAALEAGGQAPVCAACALDPVAVYGGCGLRVLECHHLDPLASGERRTRLVDIALLCANCHSALHARGVLTSLEELRADLPSTYLRAVAAASTP